MKGRVAVGGVKIDDSASYWFAAFRADVIDNEVQSHVSSLSLLANGGHSKGSGKIVRAWTHGRFAMASQSESDIATLPGNLSRTLRSVMHRSNFKLGH